MVIILFLTIFSFSVNNDSNGSERPLEKIDYISITDDEDIISENLHKTTQSIDTRGSRNANDLIENNAHGGSWLDTFSDDTGISWASTYNVGVKTGDVVLNKTIDIDPYTIALWHCDENSGTTINDETIYNNDGILGGDGIGTDLPSWTTGKFGYGLSFDGTNDYIDVPDSTSLSITGSITLEVWMKFSNTPSSGRNYCIMKKRISASNSYQLVIRDTGKVRFNIDTGTPVIIDSNTAIDDNQWHYVAATWDQSQIKLYVDGKSDATALSQTGSMSDTSDKLAIGYPTTNINPSSWNYYDGLFDEGRISKIARSALEIKDIYENGSSLNDPVGDLVSKTITLPDGMRWDTIIINKTQQLNKFINVTILNATNNQPIPGSITYTTDGDFDISSIDPVQYPSIRLKAQFEGNQSVSPRLHYWGVSWNTTNAWRDTLYGGFKRTTQNITYGDGESWVIPSRTDWYKYPNNPILAVGPGSSWDSNFASSPSIIYNGTSYMMWYHGSSGSSLQIGFATSTDGISWTKYSGNPVLSHSPGISWENDRISSPRVIYNGTGYMMWYSGYNTPSTSWQTGLATSSDGINWQKHPNNPVLKTGSGSAWDNHYARIDDVEYDGVMYKAWYTGLAQINPPTQAPYRIGYATSYDGVNWQKYAGNPVLQGPMGWYNGLVGMNVLIEWGKYYGWYSYKPTGSGGGNSIHLATSNDGISWLKSSSNPVLQVGSSGVWDDYLVAAPEVHYKDKQYWMYYTGHDGTAQQIGLAFSKFLPNGRLTSGEITLPPKSHYDRLIINRSVPLDNYLNVTILDGQTDTPIQGFEKLTERNIDISSINPIDHPSIKLQAIFESNREDTPILYDWSINWTKNTPPTFIDARSVPEVYRTKSAHIEIDLADKEQHESLLTLDVEYKAPSDIDWQDDYISNQEYSNYSWRCRFTPKINAELGYYSFRFSCNDYFQESNITIKTDFIKVLNNKPTKPDVLITQSEPRTRDPLSAIAWNSTDIETPANNIEYWYQWYKNNTYLPEFDNITVIPSVATKKEQTWRCMVYPFDGDDVGEPGLAEVTIMNTPPAVGGDDDLIDYIQMVEDSKLVVEDLLYSLFYDRDLDNLSFRCTGQNNITVTISQDNSTIELVPKENWFGTEYITFYANDTSPIEAKTTVEFNVVPANDLPEIVSVGNQLTTWDHPELDFVVNEDEWLNLTITVSDIDGDVERGMIKYISNITARDNLFIDQNELFFKPINEDVGWHFINFSVTDNNETPIEYISQRIRILVLNVNDPPTVEIIEPKDGEELSENENFTLSCLSTDPDFIIKEYSETHTYRWYTNKSEIGDLGSSQQLTNITLPPGNYTLFVEVEDKGKAKAVDSIKINIKEVPKKTTGRSEISSNLFIWIGLIIIIIIIILIIVLFFVLSKKKKEKLAALGLPQQEVLQPMAVYQPDRQLPAMDPAAPTLITQTAPQVTTGQVIPQSIPQVVVPQMVSEPAAQLPPVQPVVRPGPTPQEQQVGIETGLTPQQKLALLEERLLNGEIDQDIYLNLKAKYDMEAKPYQPPPQLPPAQLSPTTSEQQEITTQVPQVMLPVQEQPPPEPTILPQETPPEPVALPQESPPGILPPQMEQPQVTEEPVEPVQQQPPEVPTDLPADAYQQPPVQLNPQPTMPQPIPQPQPEPQPQTQPLPQPAPQVQPRPQQQIQEQQPQPQAPKKPTDQTNHE